MRNFVTVPRLRQVSKRRRMEYCMLTDKANVVLISHSIRLGKAVTVVDTLTHPRQFSQKRSTIADCIAAIPAFKKGAPLICGR